MCRYAAWGDVQWLSWVGVGTGSFPGLGPKRTGRFSPQSKAPYILMKERMRSFVVPEGLNDSPVSLSLVVPPFSARTDLN